MSRLLSVLVAVLVVGPAQAAPKLKGQALFVPTTVGATLEYRWEGSSGGMTRRVTAVERAGDVVTVSTEEIGPGGRVTPAAKLESRKDGLFLLEEVGQPYDPPVCLIRFPVKQGDRWTVDTKRPDLGPLQFVREVGETKVIETPAGKFEAVQVMGEIIAAGNKPDRPQVFWFSPGLGVVKVEGNRTLTKYTPGKQ